MLMPFSCVPFYLPGASVLGVAANLIESPGGPTHLLTATSESIGIQFGIGSVSVAAAVDQISPVVDGASEGVFLSVSPFFVGLHYPPNSGSPIPIASAGRISGAAFNIFDNSDYQGLSIVGQIDIGNYIFSAHSSSANGTGATLAQGFSVNLGDFINYEFSFGFSAGLSNAL